MKRAEDLQQLKKEVLACLASTKVDAGLGASSVKDHLDRTSDLKTVQEANVAQFSERLCHLSSQLMSLVYEARSIAAEQAFLSSLSHRLIKDRFANITKSASKTFDWIFDTSGHKEQKSLHFMDWLQHQSGIFWISGKAGSGKSTLMKYLCNHKTTMAGLRRWSGDREIIKASFFFWASGTALQKSHTGLLRSLLYEILRQCPRMISLICSNYSATSTSWISDSWSLAELEDMVSNMQKQQSLAVNFAFFVDGLDEYEGEYSELIDVIQELAKHPNIKLCVSSRPHYVFKDAIGQDSKRHFVLENYTENDIREYVELCFEKNHQFQNLRKFDSKESSFIQEIVDIAQGVFLWVVLVSRSLQKGFTNADDIHDLQTRLRALPPTLEGVFRQMFNRIEPVYQKQTARIFLIALIAPELSLMALSFIHQESLSDIQSMEIKSWTPEEVKERYHTMKRRLAGRCDGLLEVSQETEEWNQQFFALVVFMHKSVRDFLLLKDMQLMLNGRAGSFDAREALGKAILAQMKVLPLLPQWDSRYQAPLEELFKSLAHPAHELEIQNNAPPMMLLDEAEKVFRQHPVRWKGSRKKTAFLGLAIKFDLPLYVQARIDVQPELIQAGPRPLLSYAVEGNRNEDCVNIAMLDILLSRGASPEQKFRHKSVWCQFIIDILDVLGSDDPRPDLLQVSQMLISHGAIVEQDVVVGTKTTQRRDTGRASDLYGSISINVSKSIKSLLIEKFGVEEVERMLQRAPSKRSRYLESFLGWFS